MIIIMHSKATEEMVATVMKEVLRQGGHAEIIKTSDSVTLPVSGLVSGEKGNFLRMPGVKDVLLFSKPYKKVLKDEERNRGVRVGDVVFGNSNPPVIIAGPCAVESEEQLMGIAKGVKKAGAKMLRGGAFKPRTSPYSFQGLGVEGLKLLRKAGDELKMPVVTEIMSVEQLDMMMKYADMLQVGARNMQNFDLLKALSKVKKPILLKRGMGATVDEFLLSAEYLLEGGNENVVLCERGIRVNGENRHVLDVNAIAMIKNLSHLPIIADPSHATGQHELVLPLALSGLAAGADGLIVEVHHEPEKALCDGKQALRPEEFEILMKKVLP